jgi:hypothetical protein
MVTVRTPVVLTLLGWGALVGAHYFMTAVPLGVWLFAIASMGLLWLWVVVTTTVLVGFLVYRHRYVWAAGHAVAALLAGFGVWHADWRTAYVRTEFAVHRMEFTQVAARHLAGTLPDGALLPWGLRPLSVDNRAHLQQYDAGGRTRHSVYIHAWEGPGSMDLGGFVYYPTRPGPGSETYSGLPTYELGGGWWWID